MTVNTIASIINGCGANVSLPCKFLNGKKYIVSSYYSDPSKVSYEQLYSDLFGNTTLEMVDLQGVKSLNNTQLNTILQSMKKLVSVNLSNTNLSTLDFIGPGYSTNIDELLIDDTQVTDISNLNKNNGLSTLRVSNPNTNLNVIPKVIDGLSPNGEYYGCKNAWGLVITTTELGKKLGTLLKDVTHLTLRPPSYPNTATLEDRLIDLNGCTKLWYYYETTPMNAYIKFPSSLTFCRCYGSRGEFATGTKNINIGLFGPKEYFSGDMIETWKSLNNCTSISYISPSWANYNDACLNAWTADNCNSISLDGNWGGNITTLDFLQYHKNNLTTLSIANFKSLNNFDNLKLCTSIKKLSLINLKLTQIYFSPNVTELTVSNNLISNIVEIDTLKNLEYLNLNNNCLYDTFNYIDSKGITHKNVSVLETLAKLHPNNGGKLHKIYISGNENISDYSILASLNWTEKSGF